MSTSDATPTTESTLQGTWVLAATILASSMAFIDSTALNVTLPAIQSDLQASGVQLLWVVNGYLLMLAALILIGGSLGDRLGRKRVFMSGITIFMLGSLACGLSPTIGWLIGFRFVQGVGGALMIPGSLAIITAYFPIDRRGAAIGTWAAVTTLVTIAGPLLGGVLADAGLWRWVFLINLPLGIIALVILFARVPESRDETLGGGIDIPGAVLAALGLAGLTYGLLTAPAHGFSDPRVYIPLIGGALALVLFVALEAHSSHPMLPLTLFRSPTFSGANLLTFFLYGALNVVSLFLSLNMVQAQGYSQTQAGLAVLPFSILLALLSRWAGRLVDRIGSRRPLVIGPFVTGLGFLLLGLVGETSGPTSYWTTFFPGVCLFGLGMSITVAPLTTTVMSAVANHYSGTASGVNNAVARTGSVLAIAILGALALLAFRANLDNLSNGIDLAPGQRQALLAQASQLGDAVVPADIQGQAAQAAGQAIQTAFIDTYQLVLWICAGLAGLSALMALWLIDGRLADT